MSAPRVTREAGLTEAPFFILKPLNRDNIHISEPITNADLWAGRTHLLAVSNTHRILAAGRDSSFIVSPLADIRSAFANPQQQFHAKLNIPLLSKPISIKFACHDEKIVVATLGGGLSVFDVSLILEGVSTPQHTFTHTQETIQDVQPNPSDRPELVAVLRGSSGSGTRVEMLDVRTSTLIHLWDTRLDRDAQTCMSWSPKGKQIVVGTLGGQLSQHVVDGTQKALIPPPSVMEGWSISSVIWLENTVFHVVYASIESIKQDERFEPYTIINEKTSLTDIHLIDTVMPFGDRSRESARFFLHLRDWEPFKHALIVADPPSPDIGMIYALQSATDPASSWHTWDAEEGGAPVLPVDAESKDTYAIGVALDLTATEAVVMAKFGGDETPPMPPSPIFYLYNNVGDIMAYHILNKTTPLYPRMQSGSPTVQAESPLPAASSVASTFSSPPPVPSPFGQSSSSTAAAPTSAFGQIGFSNKPAPAFGGTGPGASSFAAFGITPSGGSSAFSKPTGGFSGFGAATAGNSISIFASASNETPSNPDAPKSVFNSVSSTKWGAVTTAPAFGFGAAPSPSSSAFSQPSSSSPIFGQPQIQSNKSPQASVSGFAIAPGKAFGSDITGSKWGASAAKPTESAFGSGSGLPASSAASNSAPSKFGSGFGSSPQWGGKPGATFGVTPAFGSSTPSASVPSAASSSGGFSAFTSGSGGFATIANAAPAVPAFAAAGSSATPPGSPASTNIFGVRTEESAFLSPAATRSFQTNDDDDDEVDKPQGEPFDALDDHEPEGTASISDTSAGLLGPSSSEEVPLLGDLSFGKEQKAGSSESRANIFGPRSSVAAPSFSQTSTETTSLTEALGDEADDTESDDEAPGSTTPVGSPERLVPMSSKTEPLVVSKASDTAHPTPGLPARPPSAPAPATPSVFGRPGNMRSIFASVPKSSSPLAASPPITRDDVSNSPPPKPLGNAFQKAAAGFKEEVDEDEEAEFEKLLREKGLSSKLKASSVPNVQTSGSTKPTPTATEPVSDETKSIPRPKTPPLLTSGFGFGSGFKRSGSLEPPSATTSSPSQAIDSSLFAPPSSSFIAPTPAASTQLPTFSISPTASGSASTAPTPKAPSAFTSNIFASAPPRSSSPLGAQSKSIFGQKVVETAKEPTSSASSTLAPSTTALPVPQAPPAATKPSPTVVMEKEVGHIVDVMDREIEQLRNIAIQCKELQKGIAEVKHRGTAGFNEKHEWSLSDLQSLRRRTDALEDDTLGWEDQGLALKSGIAQLQTLLLKAETSKQEAGRFLRAREDQTFAKLLKIRALGPEHTENQQRLRRSIQDAHDHIQQLEDQVAIMKKRVVQAKSGASSFKIPSLDVVSRTITNIVTGAMENDAALKALAKRVRAITLEDPLLPNTTDRASLASYSKVQNEEVTSLQTLFTRTSLMPRATVASAAALNAEHSAALLKDALLSVRSTPIFNTSALPRPVDKAKLETGVAVALAMVNLPPKKPMPKDETHFSAAPTLSFSATADLSTFATPTAFVIPPGARLPQFSDGASLAPSPSPSPSRSPLSERGASRGSGSGANRRHEKPVSLKPRESTTTTPPSGDMKAFDWGPLPGSTRPVRNPLAFSLTPSPVRDNASTTPSVPPPAKLSLFAGFGNQQSKTASEELPKPSLSGAFDGREASSSGFGSTASKPSLFAGFSQEKAKDSSPSESNAPSGSSLFGRLGVPPAPSLPTSSSSLSAFPSSLSGGSLFGGTSGGKGGLFASSSSSSAFPPRTPSPPRSLLSRLGTPPDTPGSQSSASVSDNSPVVNHLKSNVRRYKAGEEGDEEDVEGSEFEEEEYDESREESGEEDEDGEEYDEEDETYHAGPQTQWDEEDGGESWQGSDPADYEEEEG